MRRMLVILGLLGALAASLVTDDGPSASRSYQVALFNAYGLVEGSERRDAGAEAGGITDLERSAQRSARVSVDEDASVPECKGGASCS